MAAPRVRTDAAAVQVMREQGRKRVWSGDPDLIADIAERAGHLPTHPINRSVAVMSCLGKSALFVRIGRITDGLDNRSISDRDAAEEIMRAGKFDVSDGSLHDFDVVDFLEV